MIEVERMARLGMKAQNNVPEDEACDNEEERRFYRGLIKDAALMKKHGISMDLPYEFTD